MLIAELICALAAALMVCGGLVRWVGKIDANTNATQELTRVLQGTVSSVQNHAVQLENHEVRISTLERKDKP